MSFGGQARGYHSKRDAKKSQALNPPSRTWPDPKWLSRPSGTLRSCGVNVSRHSAALHARLFSSVPAELPRH